MVCVVICVVIQLAILDVDKVGLRYEYHAHLMHTRFTHLHTDTVAALARAMSHTRDCSMR